MHKISVILIVAYTFCMGYSLISLLFSYHFSMVDISIANFANNFVNGDIAIDQPNLVLVPYDLNGDSITTHPMSSSGGFGDFGGNDGSTSHPRSGEKRGEDVQLV